MQLRKAHKAKVKETQDNKRCVIEEEIQRTWRKDLSTALQTRNDSLATQLEYMDTKRLSKLSLSKVLEFFKLLLPTNRLDEVLSSLALQIP